VEYEWNATFNTFGDRHKLKAVPRRSLIELTFVTKPGGAGEYGTVEKDGNETTKNACFGLFNSQQKEQLNGQQANVNAAINRGACRLQKVGEKESWEERDKLTL